MALWRAKDKPPVELVVVNLNRKIEDSVCERADQAEILPGAGRRAGAL